ncbi:hypothetical protein SAMN05660649_01498 [Desulfotomaculum arcticum]|uniref:Uncharacterized protein n=1 Tax=Desulfotruncus arcticus DSM 17038 TaxID=1121424 RepID=A0A1I2RBS9_9FIRM|nr:DUF6092 family protein [Desulfotruncus arcticus]SFG38134.1 hypothetical protein SAMN05660649_01498 [Desulfotomaculum arcticum] [Desulfotruncus arcticus DSM 17038]
MNNPGNKEAYYDLLGYVVSSAKELVVDPKLYGPLRLVDTASRLIGILMEEGRSDDFLVSLKDYIDENKHLVMTDEAEFIAFLNELVVKVAEFTLNNND